MRLNALPFTEKLLRIRPRIVCFVGKKIWDMYESAITKSAKIVDDGPISVVKNEPSESGHASTIENPVVKEENVDPATGEDIKPVVPDSNLTTPNRAQGAHPRTRTPARPKQKFDWTKPRSFRLPHPAENGQVSYTYFWVVPNTSGLERTPVIFCIPSYEISAEYSAR
jgi:hypothetical protein